MEGIRDFEKKEADVILVNEGELNKHVSEIVRESVEDTLNAMLEAEADELCQARRYERNANSASTRAGHYTRNLQTTSGGVKLKVPKLRNLPFETAIIERYRRRESSVEEAWWKCIWLAFQSAGWKTLPRLFGEEGQFQRHQQPEPKNIQEHRGMAK